MLEDYDPKLRSLLVGGFSSGFDLGYRGIPNSCFKVKNLLSCDEFPEFVDKCLQTRPEDRLNAEELLSHKFLEKKAELRSLGPLILAANKAEENM